MPVKKKPAKKLPPWLEKDEKKSIEDNAEKMPMKKGEMPAKKDKKGAKRHPMKEKC